MAKYEAILRGDFATIINEAEDAIDRSISASHEESSFYNFNGGRCAVKAYERFSYLGSNRVGMTVTYLQAGEDIFVTAIATGGSQALFFKINTFGEQAFLDTVIKVFEKYRVRGTYR